jgi:hypothetical protein
MELVWHRRSRGGTGDRILEFAQPLPNVFAGCSRLSHWLIPAGDDSDFRGPAIDRAPLSIPYQNVSVAPFGRKTTCLISSDIAALIPRLLSFKTAKLY